MAPKEGLYIFLCSFRLHYLNMIFHPRPSCNRNHFC